MTANNSFSSNKDEISTSQLSDVNVMVFGCPREHFSAQEFADLKAWLNGGGRALVLLNETDKRPIDGNLHSFLEEYVTPVSASTHPM